ncbi:MAG: GTPase Era [Pseudohongiellaceae bacterium]
MTEATKTAETSPPTTHCGLVAIVGRPNVGKSTLLNHILRQKVSITSRKPQTTRHRILGINTLNHVQTVFVDTPGLHSQKSKPLNQLMNDAVRDTLRDVDVVLFVIERLGWSEADKRVLEAISSVRVPVLLLINKVDMLADKSKLLPHINMLAEQFRFTEIIPISALGGHNLPALEQAITGLLPEGPFLFPADQVTDRSSRFLAAELIREKVTRQLGDELPYEATVEIEKFEQGAELLTIHGLVLVEKSGQKKILIGKDGERLKRIGSAAREDMERLFACKVMLNLWVKVRSGWSDDIQTLRSLGYGS